ncbi:MAG: CPBP family intramembrane metalloprotease [Acidobacteriales bacterium]|nr:CPBP family intramembrane metalloprotease [Terriglobales bacterium]
MSTPDLPVPSGPTPVVESAPPPPPIRLDPAWNLWDVLLIVAVFFFSTILLSVVGILVGQFLPAFHGLQPESMAKMPLFFVPVQLLGTLATLIFTRIYVELRSREPFWHVIRWNLPQWGFVWQLCMAGVLLALVVQLTGRFLPVPRDLPVNEYFKTRDGVLLMIAYGVLAAPIAEELFFRGLLYPALRRQLLSVKTLATTGVVMFGVSAVPFVMTYQKGGKISPYGVMFLALGVVLMLAARGVKDAPQEALKWASVAAIVITAISFSLMHSGQLAGAWAPLLMLFFVGMVLTLVRVRLNSTAASWLVHMSYNATLFLFILLSSGGLRRVPGS